jgi:hypothetical protein
MLMDMKVIIVCCNLTYFTFFVKAAYYCRFSHVY